MKKSKKSDNQVYYPKTVPDTITAKLDRLAKKASDCDFKERLEFIKNTRQTKQNRIQTTTEDRNTHAINTIINWFEAGKRTIPYLFFNYHIEEQQEFTLLLNKLKGAGCILGFSTNPYKDIYHAEYIFDDININMLIKFKDSSSSVQFPPGETIKYINHILYFKLGDGTPDVIDFSDAHKWRKVIESFLELRKRTSTNTYTISKVISIYYELFNESTTRRQLSADISNIRNKKIKKNLKDRFRIQYNRSQSAWKFDIH